MDIILHLGGNIQRALAAIETAKAFPDSKIVISSESIDCLRIYKDGGINPDRILVDNQAWDTVTNLTHTYKLLKELNCTRLFVVTDQFHTYRSSLITLCVWGGRIPFYIVPYGHSINPSDEEHTKWDFFRALLWRCTGILLYWKSVRKQRTQFKPEHGHSWIEIGI